MDRLIDLLYYLDLGSDQQGRTATTRAELQTALASLRAQSRDLSSRLESVSALVSELGVSPQSRERRSWLYGLHRLTSHVVQYLQLGLDEGIEALEGQALRLGESVEALELQALGLHEGIEELEWQALGLEEGVEELERRAQISVICEISSLGNADPLCKRLVDFFGLEIHSITREVLAEAGNPPDKILWRIAERCYFETCRGGKLDFDNYFHSWAPLGWPYDPEFLCNLRYAADCRSSSWPGYWTRVLNACPSGPTLFNVPRAMWAPETCSPRPVSSSYQEETPRYLFRTFDGRSSGLNNETIIASQASKEKMPNSRVDFLSLDMTTKAELLHRHLDRRPYSRATSSYNLVSWTTSLLFVIQCAVWRHRTSKNSPGLDSIFICAVDTEKFPRGQFAQDKQMIRTCKDAASSEAQSFFDFRMNRPEYYNGEYLSQGSLNYSGRGRVVSLRTLMESGLLYMYPEFDETRGWTNGVRALRQRWSSEEPLSREDLERAVRIAKTCFGDFGGIEIPLMLVCFKARELSNSASNCMSSFCLCLCSLLTFLTDVFNMKGVPEWGRYPDEVRRYLEVTAAVANGFELSWGHKESIWS